MLHPQYTKSLKTFRIVPSLLSNVGNSSFGIRASAATELVHVTLELILSPDGALATENAVILIPQSHRSEIIDPNEAVTRFAAGYVILRRRIADTLGPGGCCQPLASADGPRLSTVGFDCDPPKEFGYRGAVQCSEVLVCTKGASGVGKWRGKWFTEG